ncbi:MAG: Na/Pi cotransporter family protein [Alphaproteobacteria bacterium]|nr:Na/Pi cotransporter family protein [Alphaproteobacteria bacterium]
MEVARQIGAFAGGLGLFLLGVWLMTDGLKFAAGGALQRILRRGTGSPLAGLLSGIVVTAMVQSSSAVTVATIGFVNAGLLSLARAVWVIFGSNIGTTMTGWLVALIGIKLQIEPLALPFIGVGMLLRLGAPGRRAGAIGQAIAGFGAFFLGIGILQGAFADIGSRFDVTALPQTGLPAILLFVAAGVVLTFLTQASAAVMAIALTAAAGGALPLEPAAAIVIGANIGTTTTALMAVIGATANAKRVAMAHVVFNLGSGIIGVLTLPILLSGIEMLRHIAGAPDGPATTLAAFHTIFNLLGVALVWPLAPRLVAFLRSRFVSAEERAMQPRHLDDNVLAVPVLAVDGLLLETQRLGRLSLDLVDPAARPPDRAGHRERLSRSETIHALAQAIRAFAIRLNRETLPHEVATAMPGILRATQHYEAVADLILGLDPGVLERPGMEDAGLHSALDEFRGALTGLARRADTSEDSYDDEAREQAMATLERAYQRCKALLLQEAADRRLDVMRMDEMMRTIGQMRRAADRANRAAARLRPLLAVRAAQAVPGGREVEKAGAAPPPPS